MSKVTRGNIWNLLAQDPCAAQMITQEQQTKYSARMKKHRGEDRGKSTDRTCKVQKEHGKVEGEYMFNYTVAIISFSQHGSKGRLPSVQVRRTEVEMPEGVQQTATRVCS